MRGRSSAARITAAVQRGRQFGGKVQTTPNVATAHTPHGYLYYDKGVLKEEWSKVLRSNWQYGGVLSSLSEPGDYISDELDGEPYLAMRSDIDNELRVFYNVCRHHAAALVPRSKGDKLMRDPKSKQCTLRCPYHGWCYNTRGELTKAVGIQGMKDFKAGKRTTLLPIDSVHDFDHFLPLLSNLFFLIDLDSTNSNRGIHDHQSKMDSSQSSSHSNRNHLGLSRLSVINDALIEHGFDYGMESEPSGMKSLVHVGQKEYTLQCNWKVFIENYLDGGYHVPHLHEDLTSQLDLSSYSISCHPGGVSLQCSLSAESGNAGKSTITMSEEDRMAAERVGNGAVYAFIYPNLMINRYGPWLDINHVVPLDHQTCRVRYDWWCERHLASDARFVEESLKSSEQVQIEDMGICESVFKGVCSSAYAKHRGRYAPQFESPMFQFHELYHSQMGLAFD